MPRQASASSNEFYFTKGSIVMIIARIALAIAILTVIPLTPTYAYEKCKDNDKGCQDRQARVIRDEVLNKVKDTCGRRVDKDYTSYCTYYGMIAVYEYVEKGEWVPKVPNR